MFVEEELFEGNNLYRCAQCDRLVTAAKVGVGDGQGDTSVVSVPRSPFMLFCFVFRSSSCR